MPASRILLTALLLGGGPCLLAQPAPAEPAWLPQAYVDSVLAYGPRPGFQRLLDPVSFLTMRRTEAETGKRPNVLGFCSPYNEYGELRLNQGLLRRGQRQQMPFQQQMQLVRVHGQWTTPFPQARFFVSLHQDRLLLEIVEAERTEPVWFTSRILGQPVGSYWEQLLRLHLRGRYLLTDSTGHHQPVELHYADGRLSGWPGYVGYAAEQAQVLQPGNIDEEANPTGSLLPGQHRATFYSVIRLRRADGRIEDYVTTYLAEARELPLYRFRYTGEFGNGVQLAARPVWVLLR